MIHLSKSRWMWRNTFATKKSLSNKIADDPARHEMMCIKASCSLLLKCLPIEDNQWNLTDYGSDIPSTDRVPCYHPNTIHSCWFVIGRQVELYPLCVAWLCLVWEAVSHSPLTAMHCFNAPGDFPWLPAQGLLHSSVVPLISRGMKLAK